MKILFCIESLCSGGKERRLVELIKGMAKYQDVEMELVLTKKEIHYTDIFDTGIKIHYTLRKGLKKDPRIFWYFYKIAKNFKPDVIHVWGNMVAIYTIPAKSLLKIPMVNSQITDAPKNIKGGILSHKLPFLYSDMIIANSHAGIKSYKVKSRKVMVVYNGFDFDRIKTLNNHNRVREQFNIETKYVVGMVASFSSKKDYRTYIKAALLILKERNDITFLCVGSGNDGEFRKMIQNKQKSNIKFLGKQYNIESIMNICDIGVLSTYTEGISNAIMEFMSLGKPVIATKGGGTSELIIDSNTGFLVEQRNIENLSTKIVQLIRDDNLRQRLGKNARTTVKNKFGIDRMIAEFYNSYINTSKNES